MRAVTPFLVAVMIAGLLTGAVLWSAATPSTASGMPTLAASEAGQASRDGGRADGCTGEAPVSAATAPAARYEGGAVTGTTTGDLRAFTLRYNELRAGACLEPIAPERIVWSECLEQRLVWMAGDPSTDPASAWGHLGTARSDGVPSTGCDGNLAGGDGNTGATVALKWWDSPPHRASLYRPGADPGKACIAFAMTHGGVPAEPASFTRAAAVWTAC